MQNEISHIAPGYWAKTTGPDVPQAARGLLFYMTSHCDLETGSVTVSHYTISRHFSRSLRWVVQNIGELELAGLIRSQEAPCGDQRVNTYTVVGAESGWEVTIPFVRFSRHGMYELHREIAHLQWVLGKNAEGKRVTSAMATGSGINP